MGLNIGPVTGALAALRSAPEFGQVRLRGDEPLRTPEAGQRRDFEPFSPRTQRDSNEIRAGFGEGTLSPQGAALRTINRTIERVREHQPTIQDIREQFQARAAERRAESLRNARADETGNPLGGFEPGVPRVSRLVREFAATDGPGRAEIFAPDEPAEAPKQSALNESRRTATDVSIGVRHLERPGPDDVRAERLEQSREQIRAERPRLDVRV